MNNTELTESSTIWQVDPSVRFRRLFDEGVLIHQGKTEALVLNDTAVSFIELCNGERTADEIITLLTDSFEVTPQKLADDLQPFIKQMSEEGIIKPL